MTLEKRASLKPILESSEGLHLSAYIVHRGNVNDLKNQIAEALMLAQEQLNEVLNPDELNKFVDPVRLLAKDDRLLEQMNGNFGLFRTPESFRILKIPVSVEPLCVVATSFHVKPLLKWIQSDPDFLLLGIEPDVAHLYHGNQNNLRHLDSVFSGSGSIGEEIRNRWLEGWLRRISFENKPRLFVAGIPVDEAVFERMIGVQTNIISRDFHARDLSAVCAAIRNHLQRETKMTLQQALTEFYWAEDQKLAKKNIFQIARAVMQRKVKKLIVADGVQIFGKLNARTGGLAIHPVDLDHEDDDILDDLAQTVLNQGGEVVIAAREEIPKGHLALAILEGEPDAQMA